MFIVLYLLFSLHPHFRNTHTHTQEIGAFAWHYLHELPATVEEANRAYIASGGSRHRFFMVRNPPIGLKHIGPIRVRPVGRP